MLCTQAGLHPLTALSFSVLVFTGSAQFAAVAVLGAAARSPRRSRWCCGPPDTRALMDVATACTIERVPALQVCRSAGAGVVRTRVPRAGT